MEIKNKTIALIDALKATCQTYGMGNDGNEYKIITQIFLYKFINDKFGFAVKQINSKLANAEKWELEYEAMSEDERLDLLDELSPDIPRLHPQHLISFLWNQQAKGDFDLIFDSTMIDIANINMDIFATQTTQNTKIPLFEKLTQYVTDEAQRAPFARALVDKLISFSFEDAFAESYDFFATIFEYLIKDYNTAGGGKYAEYYTPHAIATIMARLLVGDNKNLHNIECYDPSAGTGTLLMALAHQIGEDKCTIFSQDISQRSNKMLKLNLILNGLVSSLDHAIQGDTLVAPYHKSEDAQKLRQFDYVVSNPPFKNDFSDIHSKVAAQPARFWAGVPNIPKKDKDGMEIYLCFIQHVINSLNDNGKACIVVPSGFTTDTSNSIAIKIREFLIENNYLSGVIQMPTNIFATTNTNVSLLFIDKTRSSCEDVDVMFIDASMLGEKIKVDDVQKTNLRDFEVELIVNNFFNRINKNEFSKKVCLDEIKNNNNLLKPGLYFDLNYEDVGNYTPNLENEKQIMELKLESIRRVYVEKTVQDKLCKKIIPKTQNLFEYYAKTNELEHDGWKLYFLGDLVKKQIMGDWGDESPTGKKISKVLCIKGTNIPQVKSGIYEEVPYRYILPKNLSTKEAKHGDIIIEISGGSPIQSTGRLLFLNSSIIKHFDAPIICSNFNRLLRFESPEIAFIVYSYLDVLYRKGYFFNLENNTTGIKNLLIDSFMKKICIALPMGKELDEFIEKVKVCL